jgi:hypothetical protein
VKLTPTFENLPRAASDTPILERLCLQLGGGDACHFLYIQTTRLGRWNAWAALVCSDLAAWKRFVSTTVDGRVAAGIIFAQFPSLPSRNPQRRAWRQTRAAMPRFSIQSIHSTNNL